MNKIISFIIPSYNVEKYLSTALDSFLAGDVLDKIEVLIVNDGSKDSTAAVANEYVEKYPETYRLINKQNGGHGSAINAGADAANGKFLKVIDADDWVVTDNLKELIKKLEVCEADVFLTPYHTVDMETGEKTVFRMYCSEYDRIYTLKEIIENWKDFDKCFLFHGIGYKTSFYKTLNYQLSEGIFYEDHEYSTIPCSRAESIIPFNIFLYEYLVGNSEQSVSVVNKLKRITHIEQVALRLSAHGNENYLTDAAREYVYRKAEVVILSYYAVACIMYPDKRQGRLLCKSFNEKLKHVNPVYHERVRRKYCVFILMSIFHVNTALYEKLLVSGLYKKLRNNREEEKN